MVTCDACEMSLAVGVAVGVIGALLALCVAHFCLDIQAQWRVMVVRERYPREAPVSRWTVVGVGLLGGLLVTYLCSELIARAVAVLHSAGWP